MIGDDTVFNRHKSVQYCSGCEFIAEAGPGAWFIASLHRLFPALPFFRITFSAPSLAAFPNVSYAFMMSFIAKR
jgi:hypothetical protein